MSNSKRGSLVRTLSRRISRRFSGVGGGDEHLSYTIQLCDASRIPLKNTTVFIHWKLGRRNGDSKRVVVGTDTCATWTQEFIRVDEVLNPHTHGPYVLELAIHEDTLVKSKRRMSATVGAGGSIKWKTIASGTVDLIPYRNGTDQLLIIPLTCEHAKKEAVQMKMIVTATNGSDISSIIRGPAPSAQDCCEQAFLVRAFYQCPLSFSEEDNQQTHEGTLRLQTRWPAILPPLELAIRAMMPGAKKLWIAHWCTVLRQLDRDASTDLVMEMCRAIRDRTLGRVLGTRVSASEAMDRTWDTLSEAHWSDNDRADWVRMLLRALSARVTDCVLSGEERYATREYGTQMFTRLETVRAWMNMKHALDEMRKQQDMLGQCIDACESLMLGEDVPEPEPVIWSL